ncbi:MAG: dehydrogenase, partial [Sphingobacteriia bacterium]|nr:dehydrogenase [Sphingobacteriia bacterium]
MDYNRKDFSNEELITIYKALILPRLIEEKMLVLLRQGKITKWFSGWGQEGISVGCTYALASDDFILPMHRNLGVFTTRGIPLRKLFAQFQGKMSGFTKGRDRSFHFGSREHHLVGMISHLGPQLGIADGIALAQKLKKNQNATLVFSGDGGASEGDFHEALNVAAVWDLPVIFCIENNAWGLSTPSSEQFRCKQFIDKGIGYGMEAVRIDGNNVLEVYRTVRQWAQELRKNPRPLLLECMTFRMRGHEEASGTKYVPKDLLEQWSLRDPLTNYEAYLERKGWLSVSTKESLRRTLSERIEQALEAVFAEPEPTPSLERELSAVYAPAPSPNNEAMVWSPENRRELRLVDAVREGLDQAMERDQSLVLMGQDIGSYGGVFKATEGLMERYGSGRVRNTP